MKEMFILTITETDDELLVSSLEKDFLVDSLWSAIKDGEISALKIIFDGTGFHAYSFDRIADDWVEKTID